MEGKEFWTRPKVEELCKLWKTKPSLHNVDNECHDRWHKRRDTVDMAQHLGTTVEELLKKMKNLRSQYARERQKTRFSPVTNCQVSSSKWYLLSVLKFLEKSDASISTIEVNEEVTEDRLKTDKKKEADFPNQPQNGNAGSVATEKRMRLAYEDRLDTGNAREPPAEDSFDIFGKFVASELRQMETAQMQKVARLRIQQVLLDVQLDTVMQLPHQEHSQS
ncbi:uncharacterized protein LOC118229133 isoform X1 [Anguilla anguilla]|uniref:MADF domain-containing protein n=2 Tax=Anguilla anguilla TaxID=7936 RepID=A0A9D3MJH2_ANGAN|nr:uncharacterized protein LOC118229133 isoform X1 [Anguilla anguilla]KAG5847268.1 hypothetical protein ANANG_G00124190 [Anguilla anguilla]